MKLRLINTIIITIIAFSDVAVASTSMTVDQYDAALQAARTKANAAYDAFNANRSDVSLANAWLDAGDEVKQIESMAVQFSPNPVTPTPTAQPVAPVATPPSPVTTPQLTPLVNGGAPTPTIPNSSLPPQSTPQVLVAPPTPAAPATPTTYTVNIKNLSTTPTAGVPVGTVINGQALPQGPISTINVLVSSLPANTLVVTPTGTVTAGSLPPTAQVAKPYVSAFVRTVRSGHRDKSDSTSGAGRGNGAENAQNSRSAGNFGTRNDHIGGGAAGGGFHY